MAKKTEAAVEGEEAPKKKKKPIVPIVLILVGLFAGKTFFGSKSTTTPEEMAAEVKAAEEALDSKCAAWNGGMVSGSKKSKSSDAKSDATTEAGDHDDASGATTLELQLISTRAASARIAIRAASEAVVEEKPMPGPVIEMDAKTINLADGSYLKVGFAIQLAEGQDAKLAKEEGKGARAVDIALDRLQSQTMRDLLPPVARSAIKHRIGEEICQAYEGEVLTIYFTEFVMQA